MAACGLVLAVLDLGQLVALWHVYLLALVLGCASAIDAPVRQSFTIEMVGPALLSNAIGLNSMTFNLARIIGPAISGVLITLVGTGWVFAINTVSFVCVIAALLAMDPRQLHPAARTQRAKGQIRAGFDYVWGRADLRVLLGTVFMVSTFGLNFPISLAVLARNTFERGADAYGLLTTMLAVGTLAGAAVAARRQGPVRIGFFLGAAIGFGAFEFATGLMPTYLAVAVALVPTGFLDAAVHHLRDEHPAGLRARRDARPRDGHLHAVLPRRHPAGQPTAGVARRRDIAAGAVARRRRDRAGVRCGERAVPVAHGRVTYGTGCPRC